MAIPIVNSRELPETWRILDDKLGNYRERGLPFRFPYVGSFSQSLAEWFIKVYSNPGDTIMEPFGGRGTTAMQAMWNDRNVIVNDLSPYSNTLCHSVMYIPYMRDVLSYLKILEEYINSEDCKIPKDYAGKDAAEDVKKLYHDSTFDQIIKLRNILNTRSVLLGRGYDTFSNQSNDLDQREHDHEIVMFIRMVMSQLMLHSSQEMSLNGIKTRGTDNTNIKALVRYYESIHESPKRIDIFERMRDYIEKMGLDNLGIRDRFRRLNRKLISCDARRLDLPDKCADMVLTSPPYFAVLNYGMANWLRLWSINNIGDPLIKNIVVNDKEKAGTSEIYGKIYDKTTDYTGSTVDNPRSYSTFTGQYLRELYRILKDDAVAIIVVGDYGNKKKTEAWRLVTDRAEIFGFKPESIIMDELNKQTKSSSQFQSEHEGGKNDFDVCVVLTKGKYVRKNDPATINFRWNNKFVDNRQKSVEEAWG